MPKKVRTAKGKVIDFDLLRIKEQMINGPKPASVQERRDFIDQKMRRRVKKVKDQIEEAKRKGKKPVDVNSKLEVQSNDQGPKIDEVKPPIRKIKKKTVNK